jgi:LAO/AO transport system kinase
MLRQAIMPLSPGPEREVPVLYTVASTGEGVDTLRLVVDEHRQYLVASGRAEERAERAAREEVLNRIRGEIEHRLLESPDDLPAVQAAIGDVADRRQTSAAAVQSLIEPFFKPGS